MLACCGRRVGTWGTSARVLGAAHTAPLSWATTANTAPASAPWLWQGAMPTTGRRMFWSVRKENAFIEQQKKRFRATNPLEPPPVSFSRLCELGQVEAAWTVLEDGAVVPEDEKDRAVKYVEVLAASALHYGPSRLYLMLERVLAHPDFPLDSAVVWGEIVQFLAVNNHASLAWRVLNDMDEFVEPDSQTLFLVAAAAHRTGDKEMEDFLRDWHQERLGKPMPSMPEWKEVGPFVEVSKVEVPQHGLRQAEEFQDAFAEYERVVQPVVDEMDTKRMERLRKAARRE